MAINRENAAQYYNLNPDCPDDLEFYKKRIPSYNTAILELGCGTGRVLIPLAGECATIYGIEISPAMLSYCRHGLEKKRIPESNAMVREGDITNIHLNRKFDLIIAPFRVFQNLETVKQTDGFFTTIRQHLAENGSAVINVFNPNKEPALFREEWTGQSEDFCWEKGWDNCLVTCHVKKKKIHPKEMIIYPDLIFRKYRNNKLVDETVFNFAMRCYYPEEFKSLILKQGFEIMHMWGGYKGEAYGKGNELVIQFKNPS